jgi:hypothetical protein
MMLAAVELKAITANVSSHPKRIRRNALVAAVDLSQSQTTTRPIAEYKAVYQQFLGQL